MSKNQRNRPELHNTGSPNLGEPEFLAVGKLRKPHGLKGEMLMAIWTDFPERLQPGVSLYVGDSHQPVKIKNLRAHNQDSLVSFDGFNNREEVGHFRNHVVFVRTSDLPSLPEDELYLHQFLGLRVIRDEDNSPLGVVTEIIETGANNVFIVRPEMGSDFLIPDIDSVILQVDLEAGEMHIHLLPGLLPDNPEKV
jgi:16S rRNA processing protein RimM